jgi:hypothetical protein
VACRPPGIPVRTLGDGNHHHAGDAEFADHAKRLRKLPRTTVNEHKIGHGHICRIFLVILRIKGDRLVARFLLQLQQSLEASCEHFAHHAVVIAGGETLALDVELPVLVFHEAFGTGNDHGPHAVGALDMAVVIDFDAPRRRIKAEGLPDRVE